jgi:hypothetical protein
MHFEFLLSWHEHVSRCFFCSYTTINMCESCLFVQLLVLVKNWTFNGRSVFRISTWAWFSVEIFLNVELPIKSDLFNSKTWSYRIFLKFVCSWKWRKKRTLGLLRCDTHERWTYTWHQRSSHFTTMSKAFIFFFLKWWVIVFIAINSGGWS